LIAFCQGKNCGFPKKTSMGMIASATLGANRSLPAANNLNAMYSHMARARRSSSPWKAIATAVQILREQALASDRPEPLGTTKISTLSIAPDVPTPTVSLKNKENLRLGY